MKYIDVEKGIKESNSTFLKKLPQFVIKFFIWVVRQNDINSILNKYSGEIGIPFLTAMIKEFNLNVVIDGIENLPESSRCIFVANHPFGIIDGLIITHIAGDKYGTLKAIGNDAFVMVPNLRPLIAAVNTFGKNSRQYIMALDELYSSDTTITHFPAGEVSRIYHGKVQDCEWQKSFISKAITNKRSVVPICFHGKNSRLFYTIFFVRRMLGISMNIELMLLPREMFKKKNKTIRVTIGKPISYEIFDDSKNHYEWAQWVKDTVRQLKR